MCLSGLTEAPGTWSSRRKTRNKSQEQCTVGSVCMKPAMQLFAAPPAPSKELGLKVREKLLLWGVKNWAKMLLVLHHSAFKLYREVDSISIWDQGTLIAPVHLSLIYPGLVCSAAVSCWSLLWNRSWWTAGSLNLWNGTSSDLQVTWKQTTVLMIKGFTWIYFFCSHVSSAQCYKNRTSRSDPFQRWALLLHKHFHEIMMNHLKDSVIQLYIISDI